MPLCAALLAWPLLGERPTRRRMMARSVSDPSASDRWRQARRIDVGLAKLLAVGLALASAALFALGADEVTK
jgi:hypothetical protein